MYDKRKHVRWGLSGPVRVKEADMDAVEVETEGADISVGGIGFLSREKQKPATEVELIIELPDKERFIFAKGKVAWQSEKAVDQQEKYRKTGVSFEQIRDVDKERIFNYAYRFRKDELIKKWWQGLEEPDGRKFKDIDGDSVKSVE